MKRTLNLLMAIFILFTACKKKDDVIKDSSLSFNVSELTVPSTAGKGEFTVKWSFCEWEIATSTDGFISGFTYLKGGSADHEGSTGIDFNYTATDFSTERTQEITLTNKKTGAKSTLTVRQNAPAPVEISVNSNVEYQTVTGFGGMNNVWAAPILTAAEVEKMYSSDGLGYNMMRIMIYPNKADWGRDVATTLKAQSLGARILASPWTPPSEMKSSNSNLHGHLLPEKYADYVQHLNDFIAFMKDKGITIEAVSIQNEPDWSPEYDGCEWTPEQILDFIKNYAGNINAKVLAAEAVNFKKMYTDPVLNDATAVNNLDIAGGHLYGGGLQDYPLARQKGKEIWMTEHLLNEVSDGMGWSQALVLAKELNDCMENNFNAYFWWYLKRSYSMLGDGDKGTAMGEIMKRGYVLSHYAKYATGRKRIQIDKITNNANVNVTAYNGQNDLTLIFVNGAIAVPSVKVNLPITVKSGDAVITSETQNMVAHNVSLGDTKQSVILSLPAKSVISVKLIK
ncbi:MAG TPA: hypothetical protein VL125_16320 [Pelobium sp.]|nr:hypothetical protein [Pelobium sp.]